MRNSIGCIAAMLCAMGIGGGVVAAEQTDPVASAPREITVEPGKGAIGVCQYVQKVNGEGDLNARYALEPASYLHDLLMNGNEVGGLAEEIDLNSAIVTVQQPPKHGSLGAQPKYVYQPNTGYVGNDKVTFQVEGQDLIDGQPMKYNLTFFIKVIPVAIIDSSNQDMLDKKYCPATSWRISSTDNTLTAVLANADLPSGAVGQTTGTTITLELKGLGSIFPSKQQSRAGTQSLVAIHPVNLKVAI